MADQNDDAWFESFKRDIISADAWKNAVVPQPLSTRVSKDVHRLISDLEDCDMAYASMAYMPGLTPMQWRQAENYRAKCREDLYAYIMALEVRCGVRRGEVLRF